MSFENRNRIPAGEQIGYAAWCPPEMVGGQLVEVVHSGDHQPGGIAHDSIVDESQLSSAPDAVLNAEEVARITQQARDQGYAVGFDEGKNRGIKDGHQQGLSQGQQEIKQRLTQLQTALRNLMEPIRSQEQDLEEALFSLVVTLTQSVLQRELTSDPNDILHVIRGAVDALPMGASNIRVLLSEQDAIALKESNLLTESWQVVGDKTLKPGDVRVLTQQSVVEYTVQERFSQCIEQLLAARLRNETVPSDQLPSDAGDGTAT
jgi:flagellar assembly protein FliH